MDAGLAVEVAAISRQRALNEEIKKGDSDIQNFFRNKVVFLTGGSGFLGKHLTEKLLRSCDIKLIYLLLRPKKGKSILQRLEQILEDPVFEIVKKTNPDFASKIKPLEGDICEIGLGMDPEAWIMLSKEVNIIFHVAATVKFDEPLKTATKTNLRGTQEILRLGQDCLDLRSLVYVSTLFSHATRAKVNLEVSEIFYDSPVSPGALIELVDYTEEKILEDITPGLIKNWPNTYTFSKAIAEESVRLKSGELPICIVRPSIVIGAYREPVPGWIDVSSVYGPSGLLLGLGLGIIHTVLSDENIKIDLIPVDIVNNAAIAAAWKTAENWSNDQRNIDIYNVCNTRNYILWGEHLTNHLRESRDIVSPKAVWYCSGINTKIPIVFHILTWLLHFIPAYVLDAGTFVIGRRPRFVKLYKKIFRMTNILSYFTTNQWDFRDKNTVELFKTMSKSDRIIFDFDSENIRWAEMIKIWYMGIRKYIIKDGLKGTERGVRKQFWFRIGTYILLSLYVFLLYKFISLAVSCISFFF